MSNEKIFIKINGLYIKHIAGMNNYSLTRLAEILNVSRATLSSKVHGKIKFSIEELITLADLFNCDIKDFIIYTKEGENKNG